MDGQKSREIGNREQSQVKQRPQQQHHRLPVAEFLGEAHGRHADAPPAAVARPARVARGRPAPGLHHVQVQDKVAGGPAEELRRLPDPAPHDAAAGQQRGLLQQVQQQQELHQGQPLEPVEQQRRGRRRPAHLLLP